VDEVDVLIHHPSLTLKEQCVIELLYGSGVRISELCNLGIKDIETSEKRIKVCQGKGCKDRYTLFPLTIVERLRQFYIEEGRPVQYLFTSKQTKRAVHVRSMQVVVNSAMEKAGFKGRGFTAHTLRHSFATHLLNQGLCILLKTGIDITLCTKCNQGKMILMDSFIMWNGILRSVHEVRNRGKPS
jgi:integrase/recombinase XerD